MQITLDHDQNSEDCTERLILDASGVSCEMRSLSTNLDKLQEDFESVRGRPFDHFYCPILHVDEDVPLTKGHVVPKSLGGRSKVLQRKDVDNGFGSFFEAEAADAVIHGLDGNALNFVLKEDLFELKKIGRRFKILAQFDGMNEPVEVSHRKVDGEVSFFVSKENLTKALGEIEKPISLRGSLGVELDARSSILATSLRTSHLCWFQKRGYRYVFSNEGIFVAWVLRSFFVNFIEPRIGPTRSKTGSLVSDKVKKEVDDHCFQFANFIRPFPRSMIETFPKEIQQGTPDSGWFIALRDGDEIYGHISIVKLANSHVAVMTPVITDARGWALYDLVANLKLEFSFARFDADAGIFEVGPCTGNTLIWPAVDESIKSLPPVSIRRAATMVIRSGRMLDRG